MSTAAEALRATFAKGGFTVGVPDDITWDQATGIAIEITHRYTGVVAPEVAAALDRGDIPGAADAFLAQYCPE